VIITILFEHPKIIRRACS